MQQSMSYYLIAYDVRNAKRRRRVAKVVYEIALGGQKSALESILSYKQVNVLTQKLSKKIKKEVDCVNIVKVASHAILLGRAQQLKCSNGAIVI